MTLASDPQTARNSRRGSALAVFVLPLVALSAILLVAWNAGVGGTCGGPVPGCGSVRNAGGIPVTVRAVIDQSETETLVEGGKQVLLGGWRSGVRVDYGQCLVVEGGPFWNVLTVIDRSTDWTGVWQPIDDWGAQVQLHNGPCPDPPT